MNALNKSAGLFEVNMPDYKPAGSMYMCTYMHEVTDECVQGDCVSKLGVCKLSCMRHCGMHNF